ncbi:histone acetyltransferases subunit 3-domain-containing protein [Lipomyces arxii]|uniref:histone acetyltransferases subunit 3-domain-containing protein n=1 Tax=Lipomyces arxii TaxID=56418 RepID=UPI0034CE179B
MSSVGGKYKGKGKGKGKGKLRSSHPEPADVDVAAYDDFITTHNLIPFSNSSGSPEPGRNVSGSSLAGLQADLNVFSATVNARILRLQRVLRSLESQSAKVLLRVHEAEAEADEAAKAETHKPTETAFELTETDPVASDSVNEVSLKRKADEIDDHQEIKQEQKRSSPIQQSPPPDRVSPEPETTSTALEPAAHSETADKRVKNPGSEYVSVQTIPSAALAFMDDAADNQIPTTGEDDMKKKLGVASYPTKDLSSLLPGDIPDEDFSRAKPANQVQFSTFQAFIEPYFRPFVEEDLSFLNEKQDTLTPYLIPPLGPNYQDVWADEDRPHSFGSPAPARQDTYPSVAPRGSSDQMSEYMLETEDISCGPLASRILSALLKDEADDIIIPSTAPTPTPQDAEPDAPQVLSSSSAFAEQQGWRVVSVKADYNTLEDRLRREFKYVGIFADDDEPDWSAREDDEICAELRALQTRLKSISATNAVRKAKIEKVVHEHMAYAEYTQILEDLDKQVDQAYMKRTRTIKNKKKRPVNATPLSTTALATRTADLGEGIKALLDKRKRWIEKIGPVFPPPEVMKRVPKTAIFDSADNSKQYNPQSGPNISDQVG